MKKRIQIIAVIASILYLSGCGGNTPVQGGLPAATPGGTRHAEGAVTEPSSAVIPNDPVLSTPEAEAGPNELTLEEKAALAIAAHTVWDGSIAESFDGGDGSSDNPYQIANGAQLAKLASDTNTGVDFRGVHFILTSDILLNDISEWDFSDNPDARLNNTVLMREGDPWTTWTPIGLNYGFEGTFDGCGYSVFGLYNDATYSLNGKRVSSVRVGLFGEISWASVSNVTVACGSLTPYAQHIGGIAGMLSSSGTINNCHARHINISSSAVGEHAYLGGLCGFSRGKIENSSAECLITYYSYLSGFSLSVGGIVGRGDIISNCYSNSSIMVHMEFSVDEADEYSVPSICAGGICGEGETITNCYNIGDLDIEAYDGLDYSKEEITVSPFVGVGGIVGRSDQSEGMVSNCGNRGKLVCQGNVEERYIGGVVGVLLGTGRTPERIFDAEITFCYASGEINSNSESTDQNIGGIAGGVCGIITVKNCCYYEETAPNAVGVTIKSEQANYSLSSTVFTDQIKSLSTEGLKYPGNYYGWDFDDVWKIDNAVNNEFPILQAQISFLD